MAKVECPKCGEIVRSDLLTCWSCGTKFQLSETFTGVSKEEDPPIDAWRNELENRTYSQESLAEVQREFARRTRSAKFRKIGFKRKSHDHDQRKLWRLFNTLAIVLAILSVIAFATSGYLNASKGVPLKRTFNYAISEYYRFGYDSVTNLNTFTNTAVSDMNQTIAGFNEWSDEGDQIDTTPATKSQYDEDGCLALMKLRAMLILVNNATSSESLSPMRNTAKNRSDFIRGCLDASKD